MNKRLLSLLLTLALLLCAAAGLGEQATSLSTAKINSLRKLAGDANTPWNEGARPTPDMNALQAWQWTDWFLANQVRSLLGTIQDYDLLDTNNALDPGTEEVQWMLLEMENTLSRYEALLEEDRLAILNGISLYQSSGTSQADRLNAVSRTLEAEAEIRQIIQTISGDYPSYRARVDQCSSRLDNQNADSVLNEHLDALAAAARELENIENGANADFEISVLSRHQFRIQVMDSAKHAIKGAKVTVTNQKNTAKTATLTTDQYGDAIFWVSSMGAKENDEMELTVRITADGCRTREVKTLKLCGGDSSTYYLVKNDAKPYLIQCGFNGRDILTEKRTVYYTTENTKQHTISVKLDSPQDGTLELCSRDDASQAGTVIASRSFKKTDSDKTEFAFQSAWLSELKPGTQVFFRIVTKDEQKYEFITQLDIRKAIVDKPFLSSSAPFKFFGADGGFGFDIPPEIPFIGGSRLAVNIPGLKQRLLILPSGVAMFAWGTDFSHEQLNWQSQDTQDQAKAIKEFEARSAADKLLAKAGAYRDTNTTTESKMLGSFGARVSPFVSLQGAYSTSKHLLEMNGNIGATLAFKAGFTQTFTIGPVPFFAGVDFSMSASFGMDTSLSMEMKIANGSLEVLKDPEIEFSDNDKIGVTISIRLELGGTIGLGLQDVASVALRGYGYLNPVVSFSTSGVSTNATLGMGMSVTVRLLFLKWQKTLYSDTIDLSQSNAAAAPNALSEGEYTHFDSTGAREPIPSAENSITNGSSGVQPTETKKVFSQLDSATGDFQYAVIGGDTYLFWIQPGTKTNVSNKVAARLWWFNLNDTSKNGEVRWADNQKKRETLADYDFAVEVSRGLNNQTSSFCALTILSGKFSGTGSGKTPQTPSESIMTTVLMQRDNNGELQIRFYYEDTSKTYLPGNYPIMPEVFMTAVGDSLQSVYIVSTCASHESPREIHALAAYRKDGSSAAGLDEVVDLGTLTDGYGITRYHVGIPSSSDNVNIYSLNEAGELSHLYFSGLSPRRELLVLKEKQRGKIVNFRVYSQIDPYNTKDRLFYLERVDYQDGKYIHLLKSVTVDLSKPTAFPPVTDYQVEINADRFDIVKFGAGVYLYWTESSTPSGSKPGATEKYMVRCLRYDPGTDTVCGPFNMVELSESPNTIKLQDSGTGFYSVDLQSSQGSYLRQSLSRFTYKLVSAAELTAATPMDPSVCAGDYIEIVFAVRNTGNVPLSGFNVKISEGTRRLQTLHIDCTKPDNNSNAIGARVMNGAYSVSRISSIYDSLNHDSWEITQTSANGTTTVRSVQTTMLMPGDTHNYRAKLLVPTDWTGKRTLTATLESVQGDIAIKAVAQNGVLMLTGAPQARDAEDDPIMITRLGSGVQMLNTDVHDLSLSAQIFRLNDEDYVHVSIKNLSGNTESDVTPVLTSSYCGETLFTHRFVAAMGDDFGYSMDIPLRTLTKGRSLQELDLNVSTNGTYDEYANSDNYARLLLTVPLCIIEQPQSIPASVGKEAVFTVTAAGGEKPYRYQWQRMTGTDQWQDIPGADQDTYRIASVKKDQDGLTVRCVVTDQLWDSVISDPAALTLLPQTGDRSQLTLWLLLALSSAAVLAVACCRRRGQSRQSE
ncbi:MAG: carboxypeptidase-like regulatory domain-containing protein [Candidatus Ventricola sp.]